MESRMRELALFNLGIDSKLRDCDLVALKVRDVCQATSGISPIRLQKFWCQCAST